MNTHSQNFAGPSPSSGQNTRHVVSSACRCQESRFRSAIALLQRGQQRPGLRERPRQRRGRDLRALPGQARHQRVQLRPAANRSASSIAMNPFVNRPFPIAFGGPGAITVAGTWHPHSLL